MKHEESDLHLKFCREIKKRFPEDLYIRHEREKQRTKFTGGLMSIYNSGGGIPDFELITPCGGYNGLYIEFKKPGKPWFDKKGNIICEFKHQYECHLRLWAQNRCAYFCNDFDEAVELYMAYKSGNPKPMQQYIIPVSKQDLAADEFFNQQGI